MALTLRLDSDDEKAVDVLKEIYDVPTASGAILRAIYDVPALRKQIKQLFKDLEDSRCTAAEQKLLITNFQNSLSSLLDYA